MDDFFANRDHPKNAPRGDSPGTIGVDSQSGPEVRQRGPGGVVGVGPAVSPVMISARDTDSHLALPHASAGSCDGITFNSPSPADTHAGVAAFANVAKGMETNNRTNLNNDNKTCCTLKTARVPSDL